MEDSSLDSSQFAFRLTSDNLSQDALIAQVSRSDCGAVASFAGIVRGITEIEDRLSETDFLVYEAYEKMARSESLKVAKEIFEKWPKVRAIAMEHRIGRCNLGEPTVMVAVSTPHRTDGCFEACKFAVDRLKAIVPIWKQENHENRQEWLEGKPHTELDINRQIVK